MVEDEGVSRNPRDMEVTVADTPTVLGSDELVPISPGDDELLASLGAGLDVLSMEVPLSRGRVWGDLACKIAKQVLTDRQGGKSIATDSRQLGRVGNIADAFVGRRSVIGKARE